MRQRGLSEMEKCRFMMGNYTPMPVPIEIPLINSIIFHHDQRLLRHAEMGRDDGTFGLQKKEETFS